MIVDYHKLLQECHELKEGATVEQITVLDELITRIQNKIKERVSVTDDICVDAMMLDVPTINTK